MLGFDIEKMLFTIPAGEHDNKKIISVLKKHPEVWNK